MTTITDPPRESFRLSMLLYDTRYRSLTIQVVALIGFLILFGWLIANTAQNLADLGKEPSFGFLYQPAGYDINQRLIEYTSRSSHLRAAFVGILNTLVIAVLGCILATVLGVLIGVARLSSNWIVSRIMAVYVEMFRNVPVLLWILLVFAVITESLPAPRAFRGEDASASMFLDLFAVTNRGVYVPAPLLNGGISPGINWLIILVVLAVSIWAVMLVRKKATATQNATGVRPTTWYLQLGIIFVPMLALFVIFGLTWSVPELKGFNFQGGLHLRNSLIALWLALSLYTAAFIAEIVRAGILAISKGQSEAAGALGLRPNRIMNLVVLPQALRVIIPPLISNYLNLTKNSSLAIAVGYMDITGTLMGITLNQTGRELETVLLGMLIYLTISLLISAVMNVYNARMQLVER
ncbi:ABC transporter permease subunit [uncultured Litoreibacter sp.]|uniref:amino acid ABC transporter permease n=1 Tax=uncultured Litoreibacter sp. TaxID=1392394 RepID=UPI0026104106|nr:ABC transporter permease subunit [uncultured Litoreibacter sp.]